MTSCVAPTEQTIRPAGGICVVVHGLNDTTKLNRPQQFNVAERRVRRFERLLP